MWGGGGHRPQKLVHLPQSHLQGPWGQGAEVGGASILGPEAPGGLAGLGLEAR